MSWLKFLAMVQLAGILISLSVPSASAQATCDAAKFVSDLTVPDGTAFASGVAFTKTWRLQNVGSCTWTTSYRLVFSGGEQMGAPASVNLLRQVPPGQMVDVSVNMIAPVTGGQFQGYWKLSNTSGGLFGIGSAAADPIWVKINVVEGNVVAFDFVANAPYAQWKSAAGPLPFPGASGDSRGYAYKMDNPRLEDGSIDSLSGLLTVPQNVTNGYTQATYPEFLVQPGDRLQAVVNCEYGATGCYVTFRVDYIISSGSVKTLWQFKEAYEGRFYRADIDLKSLAGQKVKFILMVLSTGSASGDRAIWGAPRILRVGSGIPPTPPATLTPLPPLTPTVTPFSTPPTILPSACDKASFVADITVPDGTFFAPGAAFTKTWRLKNVGSCTWTPSYSLLFYAGDQMGAPTSINFPRSAAPGQTIDLAVNMVAPGSPGKYRSYWILRNLSGSFFGIGKTANSPFWAEINVTGESPIGAGYDFVSNVCSAQWKSGAGNLPCPGTDGDVNGFVLKMDAPILEDGSTAAFPGLMTVPQNRYNGYIQGTYPAFTVEPGDRFRTTVGCAYGSACYVTFRLDIMTASGSISTFWTRREQNDGRYYSADIDLSPLIGRSVRFILTMLATGSAANDRVAWGAPRIVHVGGVPATATPLPVPTITATQPGLPGPIVPSPNIGKLFMIEDINGWAIGDSKVLLTRDGGATWYNVTPSGASGNITGGFFSNVNTGWVLTSASPSSPGSLYRTVDGGLNWVHYDVPFNNGYIQFLDYTNGFVLTKLGAAMNKEAVALYQTSDAGATWVRKYVNDPNVPGAGNSLPLGGHKNGMTFRDTATGWVGGDTPANGFTYLYKTTDGGVNWSQQPLTLPAGYESAFLTIESPKFFGTNDAVLPVWMSTSTSRDLFIYVSRDGGETWTQTLAVAPQGKNTDFVTLKDSFTWNWNGFFLVTHNSGASWNQVTPNVNFGDSVRDMEFVSTTTGWIVQADANGNTALYRTADGGYNWTRLFGNIPTPPPVPGMAAVQSVDIQIVESQPLQANAIVRGTLPDNGCTTISSINQARDGNTFRLTLTTITSSLVTCSIVPTPFERVIALDVTNLPTARYIVNANGVERPFELVTQDFTKFGQVLVDASNARNFDMLRVLMDQTFGFAYWGSQGTAYTADLAIESLRNYDLSSTVPLTPDPNKDLSALLGGLNPYAIMGLDPAKSQALFVSGWGSEGKDEAILYTTRLPDNSLYWNSVLIAKGGFIPKTTLQGPYAVALVALNDVLNIRSGAGVSNPIVGTFPPDATNIMRTGSTTMVDGAAWDEVIMPDGVAKGWVNSYYLTEYISRETFCADARIAPLIDQLKQAMNQSDGTQFSSLVSRKHGMNVNYWLHGTTVNYTSLTAQTAFTDTQSINWGGGPSGIPDIGTFAQAVQPKMTAVLNSAYQLYCDEPSFARMYLDPWRYTNIHYYAVVKPPTPGIDLDWEVWLVGFEYLNERPYLFGTTRFVWEP